MRRWGCRRSEERESGDVPSGLHIALAHKPSLVLLDLNMPGGGGFGFVDALQLDPRLRDVPVLFVSAMPDAGHGAPAAPAGAGRAGAPGHASASIVLGSRW